jgi:hypothetical protein
MPLKESRSAVGRAASDGNHRGSAKFLSGVNRPINERQLELLRRIAANDRPLPRAESNAAVSVYAPRFRGLVATSSERHYWTPTLTDKGRFLVEHGHVPDAEPAAASGGRERQDQIGSGPTLRSPVEIGAGDLIKRGGCRCPLRRRTNSGARCAQPAPGVRGDHPDPRGTSPRSRVDQR